MTSKNVPSQDEYTEFYAQLGVCISTWATVEIWLLYLFHTCIYDSDIYVSSAVYDAVENFRSRLGMIDAALAVALKGQSSLLQEWIGTKGVGWETSSWIFPLFSFSS
jgi:hypothetical protein